MSLDGFTRLYLRNPWDYRNGMGAKRCASSLSFMWKFLNIDYLNCPMSYGRYTKKGFLPFLARLKLSFVRNLITCDLVHPVYVFLRKM
jgi:hypothetical protein